MLSLLSKYDTVSQNSSEENFDSPSHSCFIKPKTINCFLLLFQMPVLPTPRKRTAQTLLYCVTFTQTERQMSTSSMTLAFVYFSTLHTQSSSASASLVRCFPFVQTALTTGELRMYKLLLVVKPGC